ncbi:S26 family signal peptidase (plasmid) [Burkholderia thailandensis]|uniref:S26 family signal peptidase n=1 Tax=Burkholderia thailandensis TaxID=57975 RepID=UPI00192DA75F|nr:S26 family signal peptidase [Burkholderia thailandensis]MBS2132339.1 S26 family signal peptidase [Burkholderia thailandensis]QRA15145.1 S26 family signal peptidase [Burkholderia thailandensis]
MKYRGFVRSMAVLGFLGGLAWGLTPLYALAFNMTTSLPGTLYFVVKSHPLPKRGDTIAFRWHGGATYPAGVMFIKHVAGEPGDVVHVAGRNVWINDRYIGYAKPYSLAHVPLDPAMGGPIPAGQYFVASPNPNSLDSRYSLAGNVPESAIIGRAYEIF